MLACDGDGDGDGDASSLPFAFRFFFFFLDLVAFLCPSFLALAVDTGEAVPDLFVSALDTDTPEATSRCGSLVASMFAASLDSSCCCCIGGTTGCA